MLNLYRTGTWRLSDTDADGRKMSYNPAKIVGLDKGDIAPGKTADIVIFDPNETYKIDKNKFASKGRNTPFDGRTVTGKVKMTIVGGHIVYEE